jgi:hypothetical protein
MKCLTGSALTPQSKVENSVDHPKTEFLIIGIDFCLLAIIVDFCRLAINIAAVNVIIIVGIDHHYRCRPNGSRPALE